jgi:hypothetical protein
MKHRPSWTGNETPIALARHGLPPVPDSREVFGWIPRTVSKVYDPPASPRRTLLTGSLARLRIHGVSLTSVILGRITMFPEQTALPGVSPPPCRAASLSIGEERVMVRHRIHSLARQCNSAPSTRSGVLFLNLRRVPAV